jgi:glycosyltransferase involved in cell wall biosynthesis
MAKPHVTVLTITYRPGYIDSMVQALRAQTLDPRQWDWILVDDLHQERREIIAKYIGDSIRYKHLPSREIKPYSATATAINTGLAIAEGELIYFMADYAYPHPMCLKRHWEIYSRFGPKVLISGPLIDGITISGKSVFGRTQLTHSPPHELTVKVGDTLVTYNEHLPPISVPMKSDVEHPTKDNFISIWKDPFHPVWPGEPGMDWRMGFITPNVIETDLYVHTAQQQWWWAGRNDSAPLALLRQAGGLDETTEWRHGGLEVELQRRMMDLGALYLVDRRSPCLLLPHPTRKRESIS